MKGSLKVLFGLGVAALILAVAMPASAQCPTAREFGSQGNGPLTTRIKIKTPICPNDGNEFGGLWVTQNSAINSGGPFFGTPDLCPISTGGPTIGTPWYFTGSMFLGLDSGIQGFIASPNCLMNACPNPPDWLTTVVEDQSGDGTDACFICYVVDETPAAVRWYDHGRTFGGGAAGVIGTQTLQTFPYVNVTTSAGPPPNTITTNNYADVSLNVHAVNSAPASIPLPSTACVLTYDIMWFHGPSDPGRLRSSWTLLKKLNNTGTGIIGDTVQVPCPTTQNDTYLAVGVEYAPGVNSILVGKSTAVECDPNIADPDEPQKRPRLQKRRPLGRAGR